MTIINESTVVVTSSAELKEALEKDNGYTYIYFGEDITLTSGITVSKTKTKITIDGTYNDITHEYIDQKKLGTSDVININPETQEVIVKNMKITGYNYYGVIYVPETEKYKNTTIEYRNITYVGPQISFNPMGLTRFIDCIITIQENYAAGNEVAECNRIEIGGYTIIDHTSTGNSSFWFRNTSPSLTILKKAEVHFTSASRELFYGTNELMLTIEKDSLFYVTAANGLAYSTFGTKTTKVEENALFSLTKTKYNGSYATWYNYGDIEIGENASLLVMNNYKNITTSNYNISFQGANTKFILNNPERVVLYNTIAPVINTNNTTTFNFTYNRINLFNDLVSLTDNITKDNQPTYSWYKQELSSITGTFTSSKTTIETNNYTEEELKTLPSLDNFNLLNKKIISVGLFPFNVAAITDTVTIMKGITEKNASILIEYNDVSVVVNADENGNFRYDYDDPLPEGTIIKFTSKLSDNVIYVTKEVEIAYSGELTLDKVTKSFDFEPIAISLNPIICPRLTDVEITITDSRINSSEWKLYATIDHDLTSSSGKVLEDSLIYVDDDGTISQLSSNKTLIYTGEDNQGVTKITKITWAENRGILLQVKTPLENNTEYTATITWTLEE